MKGEICISDPITVSDLKQAVRVLHWLHGQWRTKHPGVEPLLDFKKRGDGFYMELYNPIVDK